VREPFTVKFPLTVTGDDSDTDPPATVRLASFTVKAPLTVTGHDSDTEPPAAEKFELRSDTDPPETVKFALSRAKFLYIAITGLAPLNMVRYGSV
jgi:hypothetical protein